MTNGTKHDTAKASAKLGSDWVYPYFVEGKHFLKYLYKRLPPGLTKYVLEYEMPPAYRGRTRDVLLDCAVQWYSLEVFEKRVNPRNLSRKTYTALLTALVQNHKDKYLEQVLDALDVSKTDFIERVVAFRKGGNHDRL